MLTSGTRSIHINVHGLITPVSHYSTSQVGSFPCLDNLNDAPVWQAGNAANRELIGLERLEMEPAKMVRGDIGACRQVHACRHKCHTGKVNLLFLTRLQSALCMPLH